MTGIELGRLETGYTASEALKVSEGNSCGDKGVPQQEMGLLPFSIEPDVRLLVALWLLILYESKLAVLHLDKHHII